MNSGSMGGGGTRLKAWIYLLTDSGVIMNRVEVPWTEVRDVYQKWKNKE